MQNWTNFHKNFLKMSENGSKSSNFENFNLEGDSPDSKVSFGVKILTGTWVPGCLNGFAGPSNYNLKNLNM